MNPTSATLTGTGMNLSELKGPLLTAETQNFQVPEVSSDEKLNRLPVTGAENAQHHNGDTGSVMQEQLNMAGSNEDARSFKQHDFQQFAKEQSHKQQMSEIERREKLLE